MEEVRKNTFIKRSICPAFRQIRRQPEVFLCLLILNYLQLKITLMSKWHILGWHILLPFKIFVQIVTKIINPSRESSCPYFSFVFFML